MRPDLCRSGLSAILTAALLTLLTAAGCTEPNPAFSPGPSLPGECRSGEETTETFDDFARPERLDVLLIVDDSGDVVDLQEGLADALPALLNRLDEAGLDLQVGVATTDTTAEITLAEPGTEGDGCGENTTQIVDPTMDDWTAIAACNVQLGDGGDAFQQALESAEGLLGSADELFRERSRKLIRVVSNEDDCSTEADLNASGIPARQVCLERADALTPVDELVASLQAEAERELFLAVLGGPADESDDSGRVRPICSSSIGAAFPGDRLAEAVERFGDRGIFENICAGALGTPLERIADAVVDRSDVVLCPTQPLAHEPLRVDARASGADDLDTVPLGEEGFVFLGPTADCPNGALRFAPTALRNASAVEVTYCTESE